MSYLPTREADLKAFSLNFGGCITAAPLTYGLVAGDAVAIEAAVQDFVTKYDLVQNSATRTAPNVANKNVAKATLIATLRGYAMAVKTNRAVSDSAKVSLGVGVFDYDRTRILAPVTFPVLQIIAATPRQHALRWNDSAEPVIRTKAPGALGLQIFCHVGAAAPENPVSSSFKTFVTRQPYRMDFAYADVGKTAYYHARWQTATGLVSPWSQVVSMLVAS